MAREKPSIFLLWQGVGTRSMPCKYAMVNNGVRYFWVICTRSDCPKRRIKHTNNPTCEKEDIIKCKSYKPKELKQLKLLGKYK